jgi:uncharacterized protein
MASGTAERPHASPLVVNAVELLRRPGSERDIDATLTPAELGLNDSRFHADDDLGVHLHLESMSDGIVVTGTLDVPWHGACRRCLKDLDSHTTSEVDELYQSTLTDPDAFEITGDQLDLRPMVRELALLDAPESPLCRPDCAGLCPVCGTDLNESTCSCEAPRQPSPWDVLDRLKAPGSPN